MLVAHGLLTCRREFRLLADRSLALTVLFQILVLSPLTLVVSPGPVALAEEPVTYVDAAGDAVVRRTDPGGDGPVDPVTHQLIDVLEVSLGTWVAEDPNESLFAGSFGEGGDFVRIDLLLNGLVNPPGVTDPNEFSPFTYGPNPVFGFVEIDMDQDVTTGGELDTPQYHYLGNVVRFGSKPSIARFQDRIALDASAFDGDFLSPPFVDRHGEEFHLALLGPAPDEGGFDIEEIVGDGDDTFEEGETWDIETPCFHRAHGYESFSLAEGGNNAGEYMPSSPIRFSHEFATDTTRISVVFPLTDVGAGLMAGEPPEPLDGDPSNQFSVLEALTDLKDSAIYLSLFPTGLPEEAIITAWAGKDPADYLDPGAWDVTVLLGTSYTAPEPSGGEFFVWTDVYPDGVRGDVNGDAVADDADRLLIQQFIVEKDDNDGQLDGRVVLPGFAWDFSVNDINYDGVVDDMDVLLVNISGDLDHDGDVDLADLAALLGHYGTSSGATYEEGDLDGDGDVDLSDLAELLGHYGITRG